MKRVLTTAALALLAACNGEVPGGQADPAPAETAETEAPAAPAEETWPPAKPEGAMRIATFNVSFYRDEAGQMEQLLLDGGDAQIEAVAEIIKRVDPDVILLNEIDWDNNDRVATIFRDRFLDPEEVDGKKGLSWPYIYVPNVNTGVHSGVDLNGDGEAVSEPGTRGYGDDAFGYGTYEGQYGMALLSKRRMFHPRTRTFRTFLWKDMPDNAMPEGFYSEEAQAVFRLSSKTMFDVTVAFDGKQRLHIIGSHPTPPSFDGPEDRNGRRNHDEIRLIADYVTPGAGGYIYDDKGGTGGIIEGDPFLILGDLNADPNEGDSYERAIHQLLGNPAIEDPQPASTGAAMAAEYQGGVNAGQLTPARLDTADFRDDTETSVGNLRIDYVLPSQQGIDVVGAGVFWPEPGQAGFDLVGEGYPVISSDHRLVWVDIIPEDVNPDLPGEEED